MFARPLSAGPRMLKRTIAALTALLLLGSATESVWADGHCAHHAALPGDFSAPPASASQAQHDAGAESAASHNAVAGSAAQHDAVHAAHEAESNADASAKHEQTAHSCTCLGDCTVSASALELPVTPATTITLHYSNILRHEPAPRIATSAILELLPYAQAPPVI